MANDGWIWGNHRGGGGAPLKASNGETVTNLRQVMRGSLQVDHSPAKSENRGRGGGRGGGDDYDDYDENNGRGGGGGGRGGRGGGGGAGGRGGDIRGRDRRRDDDDYENDQDVRKGGGGRDRRRESSRSPSPPVHHGGGRRSNRRDCGNDDYDDDRDSNIGQSAQPKNRYQNQITNPKLYDPDIDLKAKKELEYRQYLDQQIEEKKRIKNKEKRLTDLEKEKELREYLKNDYQGEVPGYLKAKVIDDDGDNYNGNAGPRRNMRVNTKLGDDYDIDSDRNDSRAPKEFTPKKKGVRDPNLRSEDLDKGSKGRPQNQSIYNLINKDKKHSNDSYDDDRDRNEPPHPRGFRGGNGGADDDDDDVAGPTHRRSNLGNRGGGGTPPPRNKVNKGDYEELSSLCDKLMDQQLSLKEELQKQADVIEALRKNGGAAVPAKGKPGLGRRDPNISSFDNENDHQRSKSVRQNRGRAVEEPNLELNNAARRPRSMSSKLDGKNGPFPSKKEPVTKAARDAMRKQEKVGFGGNPQVDRFGNPSKPQAFAPLSKPEKPAAGKPGKSNMARVGNIAMKYGRGDQDDYDLGGGNGGGGGSVARFRPAVVKGGPKVLTYDDDLPIVSAKGAMKNQGRSSSSRSLELQGVSNYLPIDDNNFGGDQLDSLLLQAKKVRSGR